MHDVHAPEHPFNSLKEFLFHILTNSMGVLVTLAADAGVERMHRHELIEETSGNLLQMDRRAGEEIAEAVRRSGNRKGNAGAFPFVNLNYAAQ